MREHDANDMGVAMKVSHSEIDRMVRVTVVMPDLPDAPFFESDDVFYVFDMASTQDALNDRERSTCSGKWVLVDDAVYDDALNMMSWNFSTGDRAGRAALPSDPAQEPEEYQGPYGNDVAVEKVIQLI